MAHPRTTDPALPSNGERESALEADPIAVVSHELRTPLTTIKGFVKMLLDERYEISKEDRRKYLTLVDGQVDRMVRLLDGVLEVAKLEGGRVRPSIEEVEASRRMEAVAQLLGNKYPDRLISVSAPARLVLETDGDRLEQILLNLLENALKYSPVGETVELGAEPLAGQVRFWVRNRAQVSSDELARVFRKFERLDRHSRAEGVGLGLYIAKGLADVLGGRISAEAGQGMVTFSVELPERWTEA